MFPGYTTRLSEETLASTTTINPKADLVKLTSTESLATINPSFGGNAKGGGIIVIVPLDGNVATLTTGNIAVAVTMPQNRATVLVWSKEEDAWYPGAIS